MEEIELKNDELKVSNERIYLSPASNAQLLFEDTLNEKNIYFLKQDTYIKFPLIAYSFYEKDISQVNDILRELDKRINKQKPRTKKRKLESKTLTKRIAILILFLILLSILIAVLNS